MSDYDVTADTAVDILTANGWVVKLTSTNATNDLAAIAALVLRAVRDDIKMSVERGYVLDTADVEAYLNRRIVKLSGVETTTGDTLDDDDNDNV